jgi:hypothetical protein
VIILNRRVLTKISCGSRGWGCPPPNLELVFMLNKGGRSGSACFLIHTVALETV